MFTKTHAKIELKHNNYDDIYVKLLLKNQLEHCAQSFKCHNGIVIAHLYADQHNEHKNPKNPIFTTTFEHSQLRYPFTIHEITDLFFQHRYGKLSRLKLRSMISDAFCLVISANNAKELKSLLFQLEHHYEPTSLPPIIIVTEHHFNDSIKDAIQFSKLGIFSVIQSNWLDGVDSIRYSTWSSSDCIDQVSRTWQKLTAVLNIIYTNALESENKNLKRI